MQIDFNDKIIIQLACGALNCPKDNIHVNRVTSGVSTNVYKLLVNEKVFYFRISSEEDENLDPEVTVLKLLLDKGIRVPVVEYYENFNANIGRSFMIVSEIIGRPLNSDTSDDLKQALISAGIDLAKINGIKVDGFDWIERSGQNVAGLKGQESNYKNFLLHKLNANLGTLNKKMLLSDKEVSCVGDIVNRFIEKINNLDSYLAHGDYDGEHIFSLNGIYTGVIDFGDIRGADIFFDLAHFKARSEKLFPYLLEGYSRVVELPNDYEIRIALPKLLFSIRKLSWVINNISNGKNIRDHILLKSIKEDLAYFNNL